MVHQNCKNWCSDVRHNFQQNSVQAMPRQWSLTGKRGKNSTSNKWLFLRCKMFAQRILRGWLSRLTESQRKRIQTGSLVNNMLLSEHPVPPLPKQRKLQVFPKAVQCFSTALKECSFKETQPLLWFLFNIFYFQEKIHTGRFQQISEWERK